MNRNQPVEVDAETAIGKVIITAWQDQGLKLLYMQMPASRGFKK